MTPTPTLRVGPSSVGSLSILSTVDQTTGYLDKDFIRGSLRCQLQLHLFQLPSPTAPPTSLFLPRCTPGPTKTSTGHPFIPTTTLAGLDPPSPSSLTIAIRLISKKNFSISPTVCWRIAPSQDHRPKRLLLSSGSRAS